MEQIPIRMLRAARQAAYHCGLEPLLKRARPLTSLYHAAYRQVKPAGIAEIDLPGYKLAISAADSSIAYNLLTLGSYEPYETALFLDAVGRGGDVIDVGAHVGYYALMAATALRGKGSVWAFEPHPANYHLLSNNIIRNALDNVLAAQAAVSDHGGTAQLYVAVDGNTGGHSLAAKPGQTQSIEVAVVRVDDIVPSGTRISVIKMDTEGGEIEAFRGMKRVLRENAPAMFTEFYPAAIRRAGHDPQEYLEELTSSGFEMSVIDNERRTLTRMSADEISRSCPENRALNLLCRKTASLA